MSGIGEDRPASVFEGREAFTAALRELLLALPERATHPLWLVDEQFVGWPFDEPAVLESLGQWLRRGVNRLHMVGGDFAAVARHHPRFARWRRDYSHAFKAWQPLEAEHGDLDGLALVGARAIELLDREHWRGRHSSDPSTVRALAERASTLLHRCESAWPATTLGL